MLEKLPLIEVEEIEIEEITILDVKESISLIINDEKNVLNEKKEK